MLLGPSPGVICCWSNCHHPFTAHEPNAFVHAPSTIQISRCVCTACCWLTSMSVPSVCRVNLVSGLARTKLEKTPWRPIDMLPDLEQSCFPEQQQVSN